MDIEEGKQLIANGYIEIVWRGKQLLWEFCEETLEFLVGVGLH